MDNNILNINTCIQKNANLSLFLKYENELRIVLKDNIDRYWHSISVAMTAVNLAEIYNVNKDDCLIAGILHDYCKCMSVDDMLNECDRYNVKLTDEDRMADGCIHSFLAAKVCKEKFNLSTEISNAIYFHTCGRPNMTMLEKIIYMSDFIEPLRKFRDKICDIRELTFKDIDKSIIEASKMNIEFLKKSNKFIHSNTIKTVEYYTSINN